MEISAIAAGFASMRAGATQQAMATQMLKMNLAAQAAVLQLLAPAPQSSANLPSGVGGKLDISV